jgi:hypothetical protein
MRYDSVYKNNPPSKRRRCHFESKEMIKMFSDYIFKYTPIFSTSAFPHGEIWRQYRFGKTSWE